jgi:hypothetical protein
MHRYCSHIQILSHLSQSNGEQEEEMKMFWIPPVFKYLTQDKKNILWLSFDKDKAEALWISVWKS